MIPPLDVFAISKDEPVWLGAAETLVQALEIAQTTGAGSYLVFWHQTGHKAMYMVDATGAILFELKYRDCPHTSMIPLGHGADCKVHCFICQPWKREQPFPGKCPACQAKELTFACLMKAILIGVFLVCLAPIGLADELPDMPKPKPEAFSYVEKKPVFPKPIIR